jgi:hypothetical protein
MNKRVIILTLALAVANAGQQDAFPIAEGFGRYVLGGGGGQAIEVTNLNCVNGNDFYFPVGYAQAATSNTINLRN